MFISTNGEGAGKALVLIRKGRSVVTVIVYRLFFHHFVPINSNKRDNKSDLMNDSPLLTRLKHQQKQHKKTLMSIYGNFILTNRPTIPFQMIL